MARPVRLYQGPRELRFSSHFCLKYLRLLHFSYTVKDTMPGDVGNAPFPGNEFVNEAPVVPEPGLDEMVFEAGSEGDEPAPNDIVFEAESEGDEPGPNDIVFEAPEESEGEGDQPMPHFEGDATQSSDSNGLSSDSEGLLEGNSAQTSHMGPDVDSEINAIESVPLLLKTELFKLAEMRCSCIIDPTNIYSHNQLLALLLRIWNLEDAKLCRARASPLWRRLISDKITAVNVHLAKGRELKDEDNYIDALAEVDAAIGTGADSAFVILSFRAEILLMLGRLDQAEETITEALVLESRKLYGVTDFLGMASEAYLLGVHNQIKTARVRFDGIQEKNALNEEGFSRKKEVSLMAMARFTGNKHYMARDYSKACEEYKYGLQYDSHNVTLLNNLSVCNWQLQRWETCIEICNQVLLIQADNPKALLRRASSNFMLRNFGESVKDYEELSKMFPRDEDISKALNQSQVAVSSTQLEDG